jgi:hypothetical protein
VRETRRHHNERRALIAHGRGGGVGGGSGSSRVNRTPSPARSDLPGPRTP